MEKHVIRPITMTYLPYDDPVSAPFEDPSGHLVIKKLWHMVDDTLLQVE
jgi:hypothetical protein